MFTSVYKDNKQQIRYM